MDCSFTHCFRTKETSLQNLSFVTNSYDHASSFVLKGLDKFHQTTRRISKASSQHLEDLQFISCIHQ
ncbi:hypothetical protein ACET3Z_027911 [Daucus carota]